MLAVSKWKMTSDNATLRDIGQAALPGRRMREMQTIICVSDETASYLLVRWNYV